MISWISLTATPISTVRMGGEENGQLIDVEPTLPPGDAWATAWQRQHAAFQRMVLDRTPPTAPASHGRAVQSVLDAIYRSDEEGAEVEVQ